MTSIAIVIPFFGSWPRWVEVFFHSCAMNDTIDFFFFTDCPKPKIAEKATNLHFEQVSFSQYCDRVSQKLNIAFHPENPYKLCDLKPFYGMIHEDVLADYDFWGFGDLDLIWGKMRKFYTDDILGSFDVLSTHADRISGHLALIRNIEKNNTAATKIPNWQHLLEDQKNHALDEQSFTLLLYPQAKWLWKLHKHVFFRFKDDWTRYNSFVAKVNRFFAIQKRRLYFVEQDTTPWFTDDMVKSEKIRPQWQWKYENGEIYDLKNAKERLYLHFLSLKQHWQGDYVQINEMSGRIIINIEGIFEE